MHSDSTKAVTCTADEQNKKNLGRETQVLLKWPPVEAIVRM